MKFSPIIFKALEKCKSEQTNYPHEIARQFLKKIVQSNCLCASDRLLAEYYEQFFGHVICQYHTDDIPDFYWNIIDTYKCLMGFYDERETKILLGRLTK